MSAEAEEHKLCTHSSAVENSWTFIDSAAGCFVSDFESLDSRVESFENNFLVKLISWESLKDIQTIRYVRRKPIKMRANVWNLKVVTSHWQLLNGSFPWLLKRRQSLTRNSFPDRLVFKQVLCLSWHDSTRSVIAVSFEQQFKSRENACIISEEMGEAPSKSHTERKVSEKTFCSFPSDGVLNLYCVRGSRCITKKLLNKANVTHEDGIKMH